MTAVSTATSPVPAAGRSAVCCQHHSSVRRHDDGSVHGGAVALVRGYDNGSGHRRGRGLAAKRCFESGVLTAEAPGDWSVSGRPHPSSQPVPCEQNATAASTQQRRQTAGGQAAGVSPDSPDSQVVPAPDTSAWVAVAAPDDPASALEALDAALAAVARVELDAFDDAGLRSWLRGVQQRLDRLTSVRANASGVLESRAVRSAPGGRPRTGQQEARQFLRDELHLPPGEAKRTAETGRQLTGASATKESFAAGRLGEAHAAVITQALQRLHGPHREQVEAKLVAAAEQMDPVALGRLARRLVAEAEPEQERADELRRHQRRRVSMAQTPEGGLRLSGELFGLQAEKVLTAFRAFHQPDDDQETRSPGQRGADALEALADVALAAGEAPAQHGVRPHVLVVIEWSQLAKQAGIAELGASGPVTIDEIRPLLADAGISRILVDADSVPIEVGRQVRTVPAGLYRALVVRDRGCAWPGCDAPAAWCQVAHGNTAYRDRGRLSLDNAALLCSRHHRRFDAGNWRMSLVDGRPTFHRPDGTGPPGSARGNSPPGTSARGHEPPDDGHAMGGPHGDSTAPAEESAVSGEHPSLPI